MILPALRCACGSDDIVAVSPGVEPARRGAVDLFTRVDPYVDVGEASVARCRVCFGRRFGGNNDSMGSKQTGATAIDCSVSPFGSNVDAAILRDIPAR